MSKSKKKSFRFFTSSQKPVRIARKMKFFCYFKCLFVELYVCMCMHVYVHVEKKKLEIGRKYVGRINKYHATAYHMECTEEVRF